MFIILIELLFIFPLLVAVVGSLTTSLLLFSITLIGTAHLLLMNCCRGCRKGKHSKSRKSNKSGKNGSAGTVKPEGSGDHATITRSEPNTAIEHPNSRQTANNWSAVAKIFCHNHDFTSGIRIVEMATREHSLSRRSIKHHRAHLLATSIQ